MNIRAYLSMTDAYGIGVPYLKSIRVFDIGMPLEEEERKNMIYKDC